jgi:GPH family glycoside/pentoside/hexuronide:cation symporter
LDTVQVDFQKDTASEKKLSVFSKGLYSCGSIADSLLGNIMLYLAMPIYNIGYGLDPVLLSIAINIPRIWEALSDPIMGYISDNTQTRFGRRRPYIFVGAILSALFCILIWMPPRGFDKSMLFYFLLLVGILFYSSLTMFNIPFHALGLELSSDYHERTSIQAYKTFFANVCNILILPWVYKLCFYKEFGSNECEGVRVVGIIVGVSILITGLIPAICSRERYHVTDKSRISFMTALCVTFKNKNFLFLMGIVLMIGIGIFTVFPLMSYINIYYMCRGDKVAGANLTSYYQMVCGISGLLSIPLIVWFSKKYGKIATMIGGLFIVLSSYLLSLILFIPEHPYLQLIIACLFSPGLNVAWILLGSMCADICDTDQLETGLRREAMFTAVYGWFFKLSVSVVMILTGVIIKLCGLTDVISGKIPVSGSFIPLRLLYALVPVVCLCIGIYFTWKFPLTQEVMTQVHSRLKERGNTTI